MTIHDYWFKNLFDNLDIPILLLNHDLTISGCNKYCSEVTGYDRGALLGKKITSIITESFRNTLENMCQHTPDGKSNSDPHDIELLFRDGSFAAGRCRLFPVDNENINQGSLLFSVDLKKHESGALLGAETIYKKIVDSAPLGIFTMDRHGNIIEINQKTADILGSPSVEASKKINALEFLPIVESGIAGDFIKCFDTGETILSVKEYTSKWGKKLVLKYYLAPAQKSGGVVTKIQAIMEDITSVKKIEDELDAYRNRLEEAIRQRTEELMETNEKLKQEIEFHQQAEKELLKASKIESLGIFAGGIAHDFNNLLTAILGNLSLARQNINEKNINYWILKEAENASLQARVLTQQLLTFSKGGNPIKKTASIHDLLIDTAYFVLSGSHVKCDFFLSPDLWNAEIDQGQIGQVIHNLIINARQSMTTAGVITITAENVMLTDADNIPGMKGDYIRLSIKDQGVGIPAENLQHIFDPYFTTKDDGTGLGLSISYSIIKRHDGYITVDSKPGEGTTFYIYLPATREKVDKPDNKTVNEIVQKGGKILIMDDEDMVLLVIQRILTHMGFDIQSVKNGNEAIDVYKKAMESGCPFDIVIMDLTIPGGMGGKEAVKILRQYDPSVKAIVSSGYSNDPIMADYMNFGFSGIAQKPFQFNELKDEISRVLSLNKKIISPINT